MTNPKANKSTEEKKQAQFYYEEDLFIFKKEGIPEI